MKMEDAMKLNDGWFKVMTDPNIDTDYWPPNDSINYVEFKRDKNEFILSKEWHRWDKVVNHGCGSVIQDHYVKNINLIPVGFDVEENPKDERIEKILEKKDKFIVE